MEGLCSMSNFFFMCTCFITLNTILLIIIHVFHSENLECHNFIYGGGGSLE